MKFFKSITQLLTLLIIITILSIPLTANASHTKATPLIMVPGTHAGQNRFDATFRRLQLSPQDVLKVVVTPNNQIVKHGTYNYQTPIIVVSFERPNEYNIHEQATWFTHALTYLKQTYRFNRYNYVGHSNGGLVILDYLEHHHQSDEPKLQRLITIGTPYNDIYKTAKTNTQSVNKNKLNNSNKYSAEFKRYYSNRKQITPTVKVTLIYGQLPHNNNDGIVALNSAKAGKTIFGDHISHTALVNGLDSQHSQLPISPIALTTITKLISNRDMIFPKNQYLTHNRYFKKPITRYLIKQNSLSA